MKKNSTFKILKTTKIFFATLFVFLMVGVGSVSGAIYTATQSGNWNDISTWGGGGYPQAGDDAVINQSYTVTLTAGAACTNLTFGNTCVIALGSNDLSISGNLTFTCNVGTITATTGYIILNGTSQTITLCTGGGVNNIIPNLRLTNSTAVSMIPQGLLTITGNFDCRTGSSTFTNNNGANWDSGTFRITGTCTAPNCTFIAGTNINGSSLDFSSCTSNPIQVGSITANQPTATISFGTNNVVSTTPFTGTYAGNIDYIHANLTVLNPTYCTSSGNMSYQTSITLVAFNTINNVSAKVYAYNDYTPQSTNVITGSSHLLTVNLNTAGTYTVHAFAWIDWNRNGDFTDSGEAYDLGTVYRSTNGKTTLSPLSITVPSNAALGTLRMRVSCKFNSDPISCASIGDGEVEDYSIVTVSSATITTGIIQGSPFNTGDAVAIPFTTSGNFTAGNVFTAQLSDANGIFGSPDNIGTLTANGSNTMTGIIPAGASGTGYRIRVIGSAPAVTGSINGTDLTIITGNSITRSTTFLSGFHYTVGSGPSDEQSFTVSATSLTNNLIVTPQTNFEISMLSGGIFQSTPINLTPVGNAVSATVYVRLKAGLPPPPSQFYSEDITLASTGFATKTVTCTGTVVPGITVGGGGSYCSTEPISLTSSAVNATNIYWEGPNNYLVGKNNDTYLSVLNHNVSISPAVAGTYMATASFVGGPNLVLNGNFEATTGTQPIDFFSDYTYVAPAGNHTLYPERYYTVVESPYTVHDLCMAGTDHSLSGNQQMVINGATVAGVKVWYETVSVAPNANYQFTYWVQSVTGNGSGGAATDPAPSQLQLLVNGVPAGPIYTANDMGGQWKEFMYNWNSGSSTTALLSLVNQQKLGGGNDFALDDIVFQQVFTSSASVNVTVITGNQTPAVTISEDPASPVYSGINVTFTAAPTNGGTAPTYQWYKGVTAIPGATSSTYTYIPANEDAISCTMNSNSHCQSGTPPFASNTITMSVTGTTNAWKGSAGANGTNWNTLANWTLLYVPASGDNIYFDANPVQDLYLDYDRTIGSLTNTSSKRLVIPPAKCLIVNGAITTNGVSSPGSIYIQAYPDGSQQNGSLIFYTTSAVYGTVEMYSKASISALASPNKYNWQYFGIPVTQITASPTFDGSYVRKWDETKSAVDHWTELSNSSTLDPFNGYEICQATPQKITFAGQLINTNKSFGPLAITTGAAFPGQHIFANPYTAAIDITKLTFGADTQHTVYLYNTGAIGLWTLIGGSNSSGSGAGQYLSIPQSNAGLFGLPGQIPSMQAFLIRPKASVSTDFTFSINYSTVVMKNSTLQRVSSANNDSPNKIGTLIDVKSGKQNDRMWIFTDPACTRGFDNGYDGQKMIGSALTPQIFAIEADGNYQVNSVPDMHDTELGFQAGEGVEDTLTFTHLNVNKRYAGVYLVDLVENKTIDITTSGSTYTFMAESTPKPVKRFKIVTLPCEMDASYSKVKIFSSQGAIFVQNFSNLDGDCMVYDIAGHCVKKMLFSANGVTAITTSLKPGVYIARAITANEKQSKRLILQ